MSTGVDQPEWSIPGADEQRGLESSAVDACETWIYERTTVNRLAAIFALEAIDKE